jgi:hypothetical protein
MTSQEIFEIDCLVATLIGLPIIVDTGYNPGEVHAGMDKVGFPCLTDAGHRLVLWYSKSQKDCHPWSPCQCADDEENWVISKAIERNLSVTRTAMPGLKRVTFIASNNPTTLSGCFEIKPSDLYRGAGDTSGEATCRAFIAASLPRNLDFEKQCLEAHQKGNSVPLHERISQLRAQVKQVQSDIAKGCKEAIKAVKKAVNE